jgi:hypothetical protein
MQDEGSWYEKENLVNKNQKLLKALEAIKVPGSAYTVNSRYFDLTFSFSSIFRSPSLLPNKVPYKQRYLFLHFSFPQFSFSTFFVVNHVPDTAFPTWIVLHFSFEKKN